MDKIELLNWKESCKTFGLIESQSCSIPHVVRKDEPSTFQLGDRLLDERVQSAQAAMSNADTLAKRLKGFI